MITGLQSVGAAVAPAGIEPATSGFKVRRPSPAETPGLAVAGANVTGMGLVMSVRSARTEPVRPCVETNGDRSAASLPTRTRLSM